MRLKNSIQRSAASFVALSLFFLQSTTYDSFRPAQMCIGVSRGAGLRQRARNPLPMKYAQWIKQSRNDKMENKFGIAWTLGFFGSQFLVVGLRTCGKQYCTSPAAWFVSCSKGARMLLRGASISRQAIRRSKLMFMWRDFHLC